MCQILQGQSLRKTEPAPGVCFRALLIGYFEGLTSEDGIARRMADSLSLHRFLGSLSERTPDNSTLVTVRGDVFRWKTATISRSRRLYSEEVPKAILRGRSNCCPARG